MPVKHYLAFDLGAGSGRAILGFYDAGKVGMKEIHRFDNEMIFQNGHYRWDVFRILKEIKTSIRLCVHQHQVIPESLAIDTWGVDFGLLDGTGKLIELPLAYRDSITTYAMDEVFSQVKADQLYKKTGIQFLPFNSIFQFWALKELYPVQIARADKLLFMPDLLTYLLTGETYSEYTIASTSQMIEPVRRVWATDILMKLRLPIDLLEPIVDPGTQIGTVTNEISAELGVPTIPVIAVGAHDTASAIAAIPAEGTNWAYISSGTWSLMGIETKSPIINNKSLEYGFTNEGGVGHTIRLLKNITGLWLLQSCKKVWDAEQETTYPDLIDEARKAEPFRTLIDPDDPLFMNPVNMVQAIQSYCIERGLPVPETKGQFTRSILESLAMKYKTVLNQLNELSPHPILQLHIIGGGSQNQMLCQMTADATGLPVVAGPAEGAALGNLLLQILADGELMSLEEVRCVARNSVETIRYEPGK